MFTGARKTRARGERGFPVRSGVRWYEGEASELAAAFKAGLTIPRLARAHNRSEFAVEAQLDRMGLWDRVARRPKVKVENARPGSDDAELSAGEPWPFPPVQNQD
jgi:hypothetical protein